MARDAPEPTTPEPARLRIARWIESPRVQAWVVGLILVNALILGLETMPAVMSRAGEQLLALDRAILAVFVFELLLKLYAQGLRFFRSAWNLFDALVIGIALLPATGPLSVLRALRVLRVLRLVSAIPKMRFVVESLVRSLPGIGSIALLLLVFFYVFAVMATKLFGAEFPQWFGSLPGSMFSLFQILTLEGWAEIAREVMGSQPQAWLFFLSFILVGTFTVLNLFIAVIVNATQEGPDATLLEELRQMRAELGELRRELRREGDALAQDASHPSRPITRNAS